MCVREKGRSTESAFILVIDKVMKKQKMGEARFGIDLTISTCEVSDGDDLHKRFELKLIIRESCLHSFSTYVAMLL